MREECIFLFRNFYKNWVIIFIGFEYFVDLKNLKIS